MPPACLPGGVRGLLAQASGLRELFNSLSARARSGTGATGDRQPSVRGTAHAIQRPRDGRALLCMLRPAARRHARRGACRRAGRSTTSCSRSWTAASPGSSSSLGERPRQPLVAMCPVSLREPGDREPTSKVATLFVPLGEPRCGAASRLRRIVANTRAAKAEFHAFSREAALDYAALAFGLWFASSTLGLGAITRPVINLVVSNVGAVDGPRYLGAARLSAVYPVSMLAEPAGLNVTTVSVNDRMDFGIVANEPRWPTRARSRAPAKRPSGSCDARCCVRHAPARGDPGPRRPAPSGLELQEPARAQPVAQPAHAREPPLVVGRLALEEAQHLRVREDQEAARPRCRRRWRTRPAPPSARPAAPRAASIRRAP